MSHHAHHTLLATLLIASGFIAGCSDQGGADAQATVSQPSESSDESQEVRQADGAEATAGSEAAAASLASDAEAAQDGDVQTVDPDELVPAGEIELKQYTVAWVGSGTMGGGTLIMDGKEYPFRLAGLGIGGYGASSLDATGTVYNLPSLEAFPGTYGNARLGMTGGDSGSGRLWLRNPDGVVIELVSEIRGLALTGGVDGILIQWEDENDSKVDEVMDDTRDTAGDAIEAGADAVQDGVDNVKGWFKKKG